MLMNTIACVIKLFLSLDTEESERPCSGLVLYQSVLPSKVRILIFPPWNDDFN